MTNTLLALIPDTRFIRAAFDALLFEADDDAVTIEELVYFVQAALIVARQMEAAGFAVQMAGLQKA